MSGDQGVSISLLFPIMKTMAAQGCDWNDFCAAAGIDPGLALDTEARLPTEDYERVVNTAVRMTGDEMFGLHQGIRMSISDLGVLGYVMMHSETLGGAMEAVRRYNETVCSGFHMEMETAGDDVVVALGLGDTKHSGSRHCIEDMAASFYRTMLDLTCRAIPLKAVRFVHFPPDGQGEYADVFGVQPEFGSASNALMFDGSVRNYPIVGSDARLLSIFRGMAEDVLHKLAGESVLSAKLRTWIVQCMPTHYPTLKQAAKAMFMSVRTLQEKLKAEHTTYNRLANEVRKELAIRYLAQPNYAIGEIAYMLHFSEPSAFQSAFRRWTDAAPGEYRQRVWMESSRLVNHA
ncbi:MAG: AraC family transcriptional regulator [Cohnella sp.]|nr:AraC family transcriptional regulator [Cohnella sp.]